MAGSIIRLERVKRGMKIKELATAINYNDHYVADVELSHRYASHKLQDAIASFYGLDRAELFDNRGFAIETA